MPKDRRLRENGARWEKRGGEEGVLPLKKISGEEWRREGKGGGGKNQTLENIRFGGEVCLCGMGSIEPYESAAEWIRARDL